MSNAKLSFLAGVVLHVVVLPAVPSAQCVIFDKPEELFARADVVFAGIVVANEPTGAKGDHAIVDIATLRVERSWKGRPPREVRVGADRVFEMDQKYVVFASGKPLSTSLLCRWAETEDRAKTKLEWLANVNPSQEAVVGQWKVEWTCGAESLELKGDGTYVYTIDFASGGRAEDAGRWRIAAKSERLVGAHVILEPAHGFFGVMSLADWQRWAYRHTHHHLRQFGL